MLENIQEFLNTPYLWFLFILCGIFIGMAKTGLSGAGLMIVPIMAHVFGGKLSVGIVLPMLIFADIFAVYYYHRHANWRYIILSIPWALIGVVIATIFGNNLNADQFKTTLAIVILIAISLMLWQDFRKNKSEKFLDNWWFAAILGLAGGFTTMIGNAAGPIMSLYLLSMHLPKNNYIGTAAWFFLIINVIKVPFHIFIWNTITIQTLSIDLFGIPAILVGVFIGIRLVKLFPEKIYRYFILVSTSLSALFLF
ncbi:MAG: sulfite exporter TauE/SafE family protein [Ignavibacteriales bacterium]|nr:sulfite exporter TauE/SafE family protein [Ignavibacteriales bacterium]MCB9259111.1 sulfite exporter TauE/SafE family protein [Ignavibacteriales bacterium]